MKPLRGLTLRTSLKPIILLIILACTAQATPSLREEGYAVVIEESYYYVRAENEEKFLELVRTRLIPFWNEMARLGITQEPARLYSQRVHTLNPKWTYKIVVRFRNYQAIEKWLDIRDGIYEKLFPGEGSYKSLHKKIDPLVDSHWDELLREVPTGS
jgi:hypothetical protein